MTTRSTDEREIRTSKGNDSSPDTKKTGERRSPARKGVGSEWTRDVLDAIIREAKGGSVKHQELFLKYRNHFNPPDGDDDPTEIVYEARFVDDKTKDSETL